MNNLSYFQISVSWSKNAYVPVLHQRVFITIHLFLCVLHARTLKILLWAWNRGVTYLTCGMSVVFKERDGVLWTKRDQWTEKDATMNSHIRSLSVTVCIYVYLRYVHPNANPPFLLGQLELSCLWTDSRCLFYFILNPQYLLGKVLLEFFGIAAATCLCNSVFIMCYPNSFWICMHLSFCNSTEVLLVTVQTVWKEISLKAHSALNDAEQYLLMESIILTRKLGWRDEERGILEEIF